MFKDQEKILKKAIEAAKEQRKAATKYCEDIASVMGELETEEGRQMLAEITQENYKQMIELDIKISLLEKELDVLKYLM